MTRTTWLLKEKCLFSVITKLYTEYSLQPSSFIQMTLNEVCLCTIFLENHFDKTQNTAMIL